MTIITNKPNMNYGLWAENGNIEQPSNEKVELGWVIEKPRNETMNWLQNRQDKMLQYINQHGIPEWDYQTEYPIDAFVAYSGTVYKAISQNVDKNPTTNQSIWKVAFSTKQEFDNYASQVNNIRNTNGYLTHYVMKSAPVMTATAKGVAYNNTTGKSGYGFNGEVPIITSNYQTVAEFSGGTNPKDVVTHEQLALAIQVYKVGDIYITTSSQDPAIKFGYGVWEKFAKGRTLVGHTDDVTSNSPDWIKSVGREYGEYEHKLTGAELPKVDNIGDLTLTKHYAGDDTTRSGVLGVADRNYDLNAVRVEGVQLNLKGGDKPHNNVQPSIVVYFWKRVE